MLRVGIVAEGPTDRLVIEAVIHSVNPTIQCVPLFPDQTLSTLGAGWKGVRIWCSEFGRQIESLMKGVTGSPLDLIVIHADCSMADKEGIGLPCPPAAETGHALRLKILKDWLGYDLASPFVIMATPAQTTDTWVVATLEPPRVNLADLECDKAAEDWLGRSVWGEIKRLPTRSGRPRKSASVYEPFAGLVEIMIDRVCQRCSEAETFRSTFRDAVARLLPMEAS